MTLNDKVAVRIKDLREDKNLLQSKFAKQINMSTSAYSRIENGEVQITINMMEKIATALQVTLSEILNLQRTQINNINNSQLCPVQNGGVLNITLTPEEFQKIYTEIKK
jgi:transcriptional regulator with XRE-family HTH domain